MSLLKRGGGLRQGWVGSMAQSMGDLLVASYQKQGGGEGVLYGHLHFVRRPFECQIILLLTVFVEFFELS